MSRLLFMKKKYTRLLKIIVPTFLVLICCSCSSIKNGLIPTNNKGGYKIVYLDKNIEIDSDKIHVFGKVVDIKTNTPLSHSQILIGCLKFETTVNGEFSFKINKTDIKQHLEISSIGYKKIVTEFLNLKDKNSLKIDFFLEEDDRPMIDCN